MFIQPNIQGEWREAAAADVRFVSEWNGCLPFAPPCGFGKKTRKSQLLSGRSRTTVPAGSFPYVCVNCASGPTPKR